TAVIALRASAGSSDPAGILPTTLFASICGTVAAIVTAFALARHFPVGGGGVPQGPAPDGAADPAGAPAAVTPVAGAAPPVDGAAPAAPLPTVGDDDAAYPFWMSALALAALVAL